MYTGHTSEHGVVANRNMSGQPNFVGNRYMVAKLDVVRQVYAFHDKTVIAYHGFVSFTGSSVYGDILPNNIVVSNTNPGFFALISVILRVVAESGILEDAAIFAYCNEAAYAYECSKDRPSADNGVSFYNTIWTDYHSVTQHCRRR